MKNQVVLSSYDTAFLDSGFGEVLGVEEQLVLNWAQIYSTFDPLITNVNVTGGEVCLRSWFSTQDTLDQKIWPRAAAFNERLWHRNINSAKELLNIAERMIAHASRMKNRGFKVAPVAVGLCEKNATICYGFK
jgi:hypothetical protein